ncbi:MAG TPA: hypothetical protein VMB05_05735 [Solirubrobacteraceae bacterium]|nr:hypothetical protein [Solirubrobacteraceae bacterium]
MNVLLPIVVTLAAGVITVVRALAVDEVRGYIQRRITASVDATIESLPPDLQEEWGDEWRAELSSVISSPVTAIKFALGLRLSALELASSALVSGHSTERGDNQGINSEPPAGVDFSDRRRQAALQDATQSMARAYEILSAQLGVSNLRGDLFMREAAICAEAGLIWKPGTGYHDAVDPKTGEKVEIKSVRLKEGVSPHFSTSRCISAREMHRLRANGYWLFGVFDDLCGLVIVYRIDSVDMEAQLARLDGTTAMRTARNEPLLNNPKIKLDSIRPACTVVFKSADFEEYEVTPGRWHIRHRSSGRVRDDALSAARRAAWKRWRRRQ